MPRPRVTSTLLRLGFLLGCLGAVGCGAESLGSTAPSSGDARLAVGGAQPNMTEEGCKITPGCWPGGGDGGEGGGGSSGSAVGELFDALSGSAMTESTLPDPAPGSAGIWLGLHPADCYRNRAPEGIPFRDFDSDGLLDACEYEIAKAFAPMLAFDGDESCRGGEPYWAAKYIDNYEPFHTGDMVKLAYLMAYYEDCGPADGHDGDSEFIQLTVSYNTNTHHWELINSWLSAHVCPAQSFDCESWEGLGDSQSWGLTGFEYPAGRPLSYPRVYLSLEKHANYRSAAACGAGAFLNGDSCDSVVDVGRFFVIRDHNVGSLHAPLIDCVPSTQADVSIYHGVECFWTGSAFRGWQVGAAGASAYRKPLTSVVFTSTRLDATRWWSGSYPN